jgi:hypothetical protein
MKSYPEVEKMSCIKNDPLTIPTPLKNGGVPRTPYYFFSYPLTTKNKYYDDM